MKALLFCIASLPLISGCTTPLSDRAASTVSLSRRVVRVGDSIIQHGVVRMYPGSDFTTRAALIPLPDFAPNPTVTATVFCNCAGPAYAIYNLGFTNAAGYPSCAITAQSLNAAAPTTKYFCSYTAIGKPMKAPKP